MANKSTAVSMVCYDCGKTLAPWPGELLTVIHDPRSGFDYCYACWMSKQRVTDPKALVNDVLQGLNTIGETVADAMAKATKSAQKDAAMRRILDRLEPFFETWLKCGKEQQETQFVALRLVTPNRATLVTDTDTLEDFLKSIREALK